MAVLRKPGLAKPKPKPTAVIGKKKPGSAFKRPARAEADDDFGSGGTTRRASGVFGQAQAEKQRQELASLKPYNCKVPVGGSLEVYILDKGEPWARYEHKVGGSATSSGTDYPCIKDGNEACPLCQREGKEGRYIMYLTCVVPKESYRKQDGTEVTRRFSKKLFPITTKMAQKYQRLFEKHKGSLRGAVLLLSRDQKMDPSTGNDVDVLRFLTEKDIARYATGTQVNDPDQRDRIKKAKIDEAYDYEKVMPRPSAKELAQMVGMKGGSGSGGVGGSDFNDDDPDNFSSTEDNWGV